MSEEERPSPLQWRMQIEGRPDLCVGKPIHELSVEELPKDLRDQIDPGGDPQFAYYGLAAECLAKGFLRVVDDDPTLLETPVPDQELNPKLWGAFEESFPEGNNWLGGITGFQFGWAHNIVRYIREVDQVGNPALVEIQVDE